MVKPDAPTVCPLCQTPQPRLRFADIRGSGFAVYRCVSEGCGVEWLWPQPTWEQIQSIYQASYYKAWGMEQGENASVGAMKRATFRRRFQQINRFADRGPILDVGTAFGFFLEEAQAQGYDPYGVELSEYAAGVAAAKFGGERIHQGTLETAPFPRGFFSVVAMSDLLEHVTAPLEVLQHAVRLLKPGGVLMIMTPHTGSLTCRLMGKRWPHYKVEHLYYFNTLSLAALAAQVNLEMVAISPAVKVLTLGYFHTEMSAYPHWLLTPVTKALHALLPFARQWPIPLTIGECVVILRKKETAPA